MNYELTFRDSPSVASRGTDTSATSLQRDKQESPRWKTQRCFKPRRTRARPKHLLSPWCFPPPCCSPLSSCQSSGVTRLLVLPRFTAMPGSAGGTHSLICLRRGLVFPALLLITELGERATPTHWLTGSFAKHSGTVLVKMWRTSVYALFFFFFLWIHSHILLIYRLLLICWVPSL